MPKEIKKEIVRRSLKIVTTLSFLIVATCLWFHPNNNIIEAQSRMMFGTKGIAFMDLSDGIHLEEAIPVSDETGSSVEPYVFSITNHGRQETKYQLVFQNITSQDGDCSPLANHYLRYTLQEDDKEYSEPVNLTENGILLTTNLEHGKSHEYRLKFWIDEAADEGAMDKCFQAKVTAVPRS